MKTKVLVGITGSYCNHEKVLYELSKLTNEFEFTFVFTKNVFKNDTRFSLAKDLYIKCRNLSSSEIITNIIDAEKVGPLNIFDIMIIVPCTANSLSRLVNGAYDCPVALCAKAMIRNSKNVIIGISSNDILGLSGINFMKCINMKHFYALPIYQDDPITKPNSCTSDYSCIKETIIKALNNGQIQPILKEIK